MFGLLIKKLPQSDDEEGIVTATVYPDKRWRVRHEGTEWFAHSSHSVTFKVGDFVRVVGRINATTKLIEPT